MSILTSELGSLWLLSLSATRTSMKSPPISQWSKYNFTANRASRG